MQSAATTIPDILHTVFCKNRSAVAQTERSAVAQTERSAVAQTERSAVAQTERESNHLHT